MKQWKKSVKNEKGAKGGEMRRKEELRPKNRES